MVRGLLVGADYVYIPWSERGHFSSIILCNASASARLLAKCDNNVTILYPYQHGRNRIYPMQNSCNKGGTKTRIRPSYFT